MAKSLEMIIGSIMEECDHTDVADGHRVQRNWG